MRRPTDPAAGRRSQRPSLTRDVRRLLAVVAHPDDESFGLGALLDRFSACGIDASVLCFTRGEASTLGDRQVDLARIRAAELRAAAAVLDVDNVELLTYPGRTPRRDVRRRTCPACAEDDRRGRAKPSVGVRRHWCHRHPDHRRATEAAVAAAGANWLPVLAWVIPDDVANALNDRHGTAFRGRPAPDIDAQLSVSRIRQRRAIAAHASQASGNLVLQHRLRLLGDAEHVRLLYSPDEAGR